MDNQGLFQEIKRKDAKKIIPLERIKNHKEFYIYQSDDEIINQAKRCMNCGIPFCHNACPLGNFLPDLNELIIENNWKEALEILIQKNNFPEFTGRLCPALCEGSCSLSINGESVITREIELAIIEKGFKEGYVKPITPEYRLDKKVAIIGSGPSGLAVAEELNKKGVNVSIYEKSSKAGGLLRLGIPDYKIEKHIVDRRIELMKKAGIKFECNVEIGTDISIDELKSEYDSICICAGFTEPRKINASGNDLNGIHFALDYLKQQNYVNDFIEIKEKNINAKDKNVLIIGGGDTGADCAGIAIRQGAKSVHQIEIMEKPPSKRNAYTPWPYFPNVLRKNTSDEEGTMRSWEILTSEFLGDNKVKEVKCNKVKWIENNGKKEMEVIEEKEFNIVVDLVIIAAGFVNIENPTIYENLGINFTHRNVINTKNNQTNIEGVFASGDIKNGPSLICKAISDGRKASKEIIKYLKV